MQRPPPAAPESDNDVDIYYYVRGPAKNVDALSKALEPKTGMNWPTGGTVNYGKGRVYTSTRGRVRKVDLNPVTVREAGVQTMLMRALQWLANRPVTWVAPVDSLTGNPTSIRSELTLPVNVPTHVDQHG